MRFKQGLIAFSLMTLVTQAVAFEPLLDAERLDNQVIHYFQQGRFQEALPLAEKALSIKMESLGEKHLATLISLNNLALIYKNLGRFSEALSLLERGYALKQAILGEKHPSTLTTLNNLALVYQSLGDLDKALPLFEKCYRLRKAVLGKRHIDTLASLNNLASIYQQLGHLSRALELTQKSYRLLKEVKGESHPNTLLSMNNLAQIYRLLGDLDKALSLQESNSRLYQATLGEQHPDSIQSLNNLAIIYHYLGRLDEALPLFEKSYKRYQKVLGEKHPNTLTSLNNLAEIHRALGHLEQALPLFERDYELSKAVLGNAHPKNINKWNNFAKIYINLGRAADALHLFEKAYRLSQKVLGPKHPDTITSLNNLAVAYQALGDLEKALPLFEQSYPLTQAIFDNKHINTLNILGNLAAIHQKLGHFSKALRLHKSSFHLSKELLGEAHPETLTHLNNLATLYLYFERFSDALPLLKEAYRLSKRGLGEAHPDTIRNLNNLAYTYAKQGQTHQAIQHFERFVARVENLRRGDLSAENRQRLFKEWVHAYLKLSEQYIHQSRFQDAFRIAEMSKSRTLLESLATQLAAQYPGLTATEQRQLRNQETNLALLTDRIAKALENNNLEEKHSLETEKNQQIKALKQFHRALMAKYPKYAQLSKVQIVGAKEGATLLPMDAVLISYLEIKNEVLAFTLQSNGMLTAHSLGKILDLKKKVEDYRRRLLIVSRGRVNLRKKKETQAGLSRELGKQLLEPLYPIIKDKPHWIISPSGPLALLPFETLRLKDEKQAVIAKHDISYVQSLSVLKLLQKRQTNYQSIKKRGTLFAMGAPIYQNLDEFGPSKMMASKPANINIPPHLLQRARNEEGVLRELDLTWRNLPGTLRELERLEKLFFFKKHRIYKQTHATEANLQRLNKFGILAKYRYLLFSTHGYLSTQVPTLSSIVLGQVNNPPGIDGYVTAGEWPGYNLKSDLMVLSACETGVGEVVSGEGVMGLPYAFYVAGNQNTLLTLWSISDDVTAEFIVSFFRKLKMGTGQVEALTATKREFMKKTGRYSDPTYWAAFVLYGV